jgi:hypothetical protein
VKGRYDFWRSEVVNDGIMFELSDLGGHFLQGS